VDDSCNEIPVDAIGEYRRHSFQRIGQRGNHTSACLRDLPFHRASSPIGNNDQPEQKFPYDSLGLIA